MADWTDIPNAALIQGAPPRATVVTALRDNPIAALAGNENAPRLFLRAIEHLEPGDQVRSNRGSITADENSGATGVIFDSAQYGTVRLRFTMSGSGSRSLVRLRNGVSTTLQAGFANGNRVYDVDCLPGDRFSIALGISSSSQTASNITVGTNGQDLWPATYTPLTGNRNAT